MGLQRVRHDLVTQEQQQNSNQEKREITGIISIRSKAAIIITESFSSDSGADKGAHPHSLCSPLRWRPSSAQQGRKRKGSAQLQRGKTKHLFADVIVYTEKIQELFEINGFSK